MNRFLSIVISLFVLFSSQAFADDVLSAINEGIDFYQAKDYQSAANSLDYASQLIRQMRGGALGDFLPKPLSGWQAEEVSANAMGATMFGGMVQASRQYTKGSANVTITITTDSPMLQTMMMLFTNPMFATADGGRLQTVNGQKAHVKFDPNSQSGELKIVVNNQILIQVDGNGIIFQDLIDYASAIDFDKLKNG